MKFRIGYRTIKTAIGMTMSILLAKHFGFYNFASAGILTVLCIKVTKLKSLRASWDRFLACILAMGFSIIFFEGIAYEPLVIGPLILLFIPTVVLFKANDGIVSSIVIILHFFSAKHVTIGLILNELGIIVIGIGVALVMNLYMPSVENKLIAYQKEIENNLKKIFEEIILYLRTNKSDWEGREITETLRLIDEAKKMSYRDVENHFLRIDNPYYHYFMMREKQFEIIERVLPIVTSISDEVEQRNIVANFIEEVKDHIHPGNTANVYLTKLGQMRTHFQEMELPKTRMEFEARAALLHFVREMEEYLIIKSKYKGLNSKK